MPLPREQLAGLLNNCTSSNERLLVLMIRDLEGQNLQLAELSTSDIDRTSGSMRVRGPDHSTRSLKLSRDTIKAYRDYMVERRDREPSLFLDNSGLKIGEEQIRSWAREIGSRSGIEFDESRLIFRDRKESPQARLVTKGAHRDLFYLYGVVSHPLRRQIVELLGDEGPLSFTQLKTRLKVRVGTLYYHFDMLKGLITQDYQKKYELTSAGREAYAKLHSSDYVRASSAISESNPTPLGPSASARRILGLGWLLTRIGALSTLAVAGGVLAIALGTGLVILARLETVALFLNPSQADPRILALEFVGSWAGVYALADLVATYLLGRRGEHVPLLLGTAYAMIPLVVFAGWWNLVIIWSITLEGLDTFVVSRFILIILQGFSLLILARIVSGIKGLRLDKAAVISLLIAYLSIMVAYFRGV